MTLHAATISGMEEGQWNKAPQPSPGSPPSTVSPHGAIVPLSNDFVRRKTKSPGKSGINFTGRAAAHSLVRDADSVPGLDGVLPRIYDYRSVENVRRKSSRSRSPVRFAQTADAKGEAPYITASELLPRLYQSGQVSSSSTKALDSVQDNIGSSRRRNKNLPGQSVTRRGQQQEASPANKSRGLKKQEITSEVDGAIDEFERRQLCSGGMRDVEEAEAYDSWDVDHPSLETVPDEHRRLAMAREVKRAIADFEKRNARFASLPASDTDDEPATGETDVSVKDTVRPEQIKSFLAVQADMDPMEHIKMLQKKLPSSKVLKAQSREYIDRIKARKTEEEVAKKEREKRVRKFILNQQAAQQQLEEASFQEMLQQKLMRQSKQERRIAQQLIKVRCEKDAIIKNRMFREKQYQEARQRDYEKALEREAQVWGQVRKEYQRQLDMWMQQYSEIGQEKAEKKKRKHYNMCRHIAEQILDLSMKISDYRSLNEGVVPPKLLRSWKILFLEGQLLYREIVPVMEKNWVEITCVDREVAAHMLMSSDADPANKDNGVPREGEDAEIPESEKILDEQQLENYLSGTGMWAFVDRPELIRQPNEILGQVVAMVHKITMPADASPEKSVMPVAPLKIVIIGKRFSGKSTLAASLAMTYNLAVLEVDKLIADSVAAFETVAATAAAQQSQVSPGTPNAMHSDSAAAGDMPKTPSSRRSTTPTVGQQGTAQAPAAQFPASTLSSKKGTPSDRAVGNQRAVLGGKIQVAMMDSGSPDDNLLVGLVVEAIKDLASQVRGGWVLVDFPKTKAQAQLLEKELTGYEDPKPVKPGNLKRQGTAGKEKPSTPIKKKSLIAPTRSDPDEANAVPPTSGIDRLIYLEIDNDTAFRRAGGRRVDPLTGNVYHMDLNPPPRDLPGVHERLVSPEDDGNKDMQLQFQLAAFEDLIGSLTDWYNRFHNMITVPAGGTPSQTYELVNAGIQEAIWNAQNDKAEKLDAPPKEAKA